MSLINDALKRAKQAQQQRLPSSAADPQLRPMEPAHRPASNPGLPVPMILVLLAGVGTFFLWQGLRDRDSTQQAALSADSLVPPQQTAPAPPVQSPDSAVASAMLMPPATVAPDPASEPVPAIPPTTSSTAQAAVAEAPPKPAAPKLEGIFYRPGLPAAVLNGKTVFVGDRVGVFRVQAISRTSVTLGGPDQTNVLSLPE